PRVHRHRLPAERPRGPGHEHVAARGVGGHVRPRLRHQAPGGRGRTPGGSADQPAQRGRQGQARPAPAAPRPRDRLMGALARLLSRRGDTGTGATATLPSRGRTPKDLLHASGMSTEQLRITWIAVSWLLTYPDEDTL